MEIQVNGSRAAGSNRFFGNYLHLLKTTERSGVLQRAAAFESRASLSGYLRAYGRPGPPAPSEREASRSAEQNRTMVFCWQERRRVPTRCTVGENLMKNIQIIDEAVNCVYDIFASTDEEFDLIFKRGEDIAFIDEVYERAAATELDVVFQRIWSRRVRKAEAKGIHGLLFYENLHKKVYYPTRRDEEAVNPDGTRLR